MDFFFGIDLVTLLKAVGLLGLFGIVFAESGLLLGFFLPGDSLLFTAGLLASQGYFNIAVLVVGCFIAAVAGDSVGYAFGRKVGPKLFVREDSFFFHRAQLERAREFYLRHGGKTIILARFLPVIRTFAPILAGVGNMHYPAFLFYNIFGGLLWAVGMTLLGYLLGNVIPNVERYLVPLVILIIIVSSLPPVLSYLRERKKF